MVRAAWDGSDFVGAKVAILSGDHVVTLLRDDDPAIAYPAEWDLPGGGREGTESPVETALRETGEEVGLNLTPGRIVWSRRFDSPRVAWFHVALWDGLTAADLRLGDEGQAARLMPVSEFMGRGDAIWFLKERLGLYLSR